jgi:ribosomal protein L14E/L6E/L27E
MPPERGTVVRSKAGRDKGMFMAVISLDPKGVVLADGKERPLECPKLKNLKHISLTNTCLNEEQLKTNRSLRHALSDFRNELSDKGEI